MIPYMVCKLAPNSSHLTRGLVKYVSGRDYFRTVPSQNGDKLVTSPPPPIVEGDDAGDRDSNAVRAGGAKPWSREMRTTKAIDYGAGTPVPIMARRREPHPEKSMLTEERVQPPEGGTLGYEGPGCEKLWNKEPRLKKQGIENPGEQKPCERPLEKPPDQSRAKVEQRRKEVRRKSCSGHSLWLSFSLYLVRSVLWNSCCD